MIVSRQGKGRPDRTGLARGSGLRPGADQSEKRSRSDRSSHRSVRADPRGVYWSAAPSQSDGSGAGPSSRRVHL